MGGDFREHRAKLPSEAFAIAPDQEPDPSDPIREDVWTSLVFLPDDVSFRTTDHHGALFHQAYETWGNWVSLVLDVQGVTTDPRDDALALACLNVSDELQASTYLALTGFYRQAIAVLRSAVEGIVVGCYFRAFPDPEGFADWADGERAGKQRFMTMRTRLAGVTPCSDFKGISGEFPSLMGDDGWVNYIFGSTSGFSHGRPFQVNRWGDRVPSSNVELWGGSNGPVYEPGSVTLWSTFFFDSTLLCLELVGLADERVARLTSSTDVRICSHLRTARGS